MSDYTSEHSRPGTPVGPLPDIPNAHGRSAYRFNWDARRAGPGSVSETTEGRGDYFATTPKVDIYGASASTTNLSLATPQEWSSSKHGFHAISTVVNNPHKKSAPPKAHSAVPSVPPSDLPRVRRKDFDAYLRAVEPEWDRFQKNAELGRGAAAQVLPPSASTSAQALDFDFTPESPLTARPSRSLPPLTSIPQVFFDPKFNLGDPRTFNAVSESESSAPSSTFTALTPLSPVTSNDPSALAHSLPLLEKLSHHADTIEQHLVTEIARRARPFFAALSNLQDLQAESARCLARIQSLRGQLQDVDTHVAKRGLEAVRREARLERLDRVREGVKVVSGVVEMVGVARSLVGAGQWGEALNVVEELKAMWHAQQVQAVEIPTRPPPTPLPSVTEEPEAAAEPPPTPRRLPPSISLSSLKAFANLPSQLQTLTLEIAASLTTDLVGVLKVDLTERIYGSPGGQDVDNVALRDRLRPLVHGLMQTSTVREAMSEWRNVALGEVKGVIKGHIPLFETDDDDPQTRKTASEQPWIAHVRSMEHADFLALLRNVYRSFLNCVEGLQTSNLVLLDVVNGMRIEDSSSSDMNAVQDTLLDVLTSSAELANILSSKILSARAEQHSKLQLQEFVELFNESWTFVVRCEVLCRRMIVGLRGVVIGQAKSFLQAFHQSRISQSAKLVEDEQWSQADVPPSLQHIANMLVDAAVHDPTEFILKVPPAVAAPPPSPHPSSATLMPPGSPHGSRPSSPRSLSPHPLSPRPSSPRPTSPRPHTNGVSGPPTKHLRIEDRSYFIVSATQEVLILVTDYLKVIVNLSLLTTDTMSRVIEFLKAFNSRMCQVVLGAGAMRSAGLKNITAKHLALASQSLSITIALIPYIRETFRRHLNPKQAVMLVEFDKLKRDYQEHQNEIHSKLIAIMGDRLTAHIKSLQQVKWDVPPAKPVNDYMEVLVKETVTLHKVLSRYLSNTVVEYVMSQVFAAMNHRLSEEYTMIELPTPQAKERLLADARYLNTKFSALKNVTAPMGMLETVVSEKRVGPPGGATSPLPDPSSPRPALTKRGSIFANDRIKGMLSRATHMEKSLPTPSPSPAPPRSPNVRPTSPMPPPNGDVNGTAFMPNGSSVSLLSSGSATPNPAPPLPEKRGFKEIQMVDDVAEVPPPPTPEKQPVVEVSTKEPTPERVPEHVDELAKEPEASSEQGPALEASPEPELAFEVLSEPEPAPELSRADSGESKKSGDVQDGAAQDGAAQDGAAQDSLSPEPEALTANSIHEVLPVVDAEARS